MLFRSIQVFLRIHGNCPTPGSRSKEFSRADCYVNSNWPCGVSNHVTDELSSCADIFKCKETNAHTRSIVLSVVTFLGLLSFCILKTRIHLYVTFGVVKLVKA
jgi:hypothetical protein